ncbi:MAG: ACT domain-containing protein [Clostridia bacterium]|nr:ACT domain-containing protein [Clostridia bacterium]
MKNDYYMLVNSKVLPEVFNGVIIAKELLALGKAANISKAVKIAGISRSAYYKYKDFVFRYEFDNRHEVTLSAVLSDRAGVFSAMTAVLSKYGANIITVNQNKPISGAASVTLTVRTDTAKISASELLSQLKSVDGIISIKEVL